MKAVNKYVEKSEYAGKDAHTQGGAVEASIGGIGKPSAYVSKYLQLGEEKQMKDMPIEWVAWAAVVSVTGRQRLARSQLLTEAAKVDKCKQSSDSIHGFETRCEDGEVVCSHCGSPLGIESETPTEACSDSGKVVTDGGQKVIEINDADDWPKVRCTQERYEFQGVEDASGYDEVNHPGGGPSFVEYKRPKLKIWKETRLRHCGTVANPEIIVHMPDSDEKYKTVDPQEAAAWLEAAGVENPWYAEQLLEFHNWGNPIPDVFESPDAKPP